MNGTIQRTVSLPPELAAVIDTLAKDGGRTRSGQIVYMVRQALAAEKALRDIDAVTKRRRG